MITTPPPSMIEKMARAYEPDLWRRIDGDWAGNTTFANTARFAKESSLKRARAALEALREPTQAMLEALTPDGIPGRNVYQVEYKQFCRALIDAALEGK